MALPQKALNAAGGPTSMRDARIGLIQFQLSPPKPYMDSKVREKSIIVRRLQGFNFFCFFLPRSLFLITRRWIVLFATRKSTLQIF